MDIDKITINDEKSIDQILANIVGEDKGEEGDILEDIKSLGKNDTAVVEEGEDVEFECPVCGASVASDATSCPECDAEFAGEEEAEFECPVCQAIVASDASSCPSCGVEFESEEEAPAEEAPPAEEGADEFEEGEAILVPEEPAEEVEEEAVELPEPEFPQELDIEPPVPHITVLERVRVKRDARMAEEVEEEEDIRTLYKTLPKLVNEVKPMLISAKKLGVDIAESRKLISEAIAAGKRRDVRKAVGLVRQSKSGLEDAFMQQIAESLEAFREDVTAARGLGADVERTEELIESAILSLENEDFEGSIKDLQAAKKKFETVGAGLTTAKDALEEAKLLIADASQLGIDVSVAEHLHKEGSAALQRKEWDVASLFAKQSKEKLIERLPAKLVEEVKRARDILLELKVRGGDLKRPIQILKKASMTLKEEKYVDSLRLLKVFRKEIRDMRRG
ncbi:MAG: zinc ribbon domain-containing protein [Candidatus Thermoplasmatota archaeon]|nr:zinc ribbon domain-containing protein [Candidatus Thermoplasmatota archaeon]